MLQINQIRAEKEVIAERLSKRGRDFTLVLEEAISADDLRKNSQTKLDAILAEMNSISKEIGQLFQQGKKAEAETLKSKVGDLKSNSKELDMI